MIKLLSPNPIIIFHFITFFFVVVVGKRVVMVVGHFISFISIFLSSSIKNSFLVSFFTLHFFLEIFLHIPVIFFSAGNHRLDKTQSIVVGHMSHMCEFCVQTLLLSSSCRYSDLENSNDSRDVPLVSICVTYPIVLPFLPNLCSAPAQPHCSLSFFLL